ncbi:hypothetical protein D020_4633B, partial [Vibrio parahaemolyticus SBR10290]
HFGYLPGQR